MGAVIYDVFASQVTELENNSAVQSDANLGLAQRLWLIPTGWTTDPLDIKGLGTPFDRSEIGVAYAGFFANTVVTNLILGTSVTIVTEGSVGDSMAAKLQSDHLASQERAFRLRHATAVRCGMHAASRRAGQGDASSGSFARIVNHVQDLIVSGAP